MTFKEGCCKSKSDDYPKIVIRADLVKKCVLSDKYKFLCPWGKELKETLHLSPTIHLVYGFYTCYIFTLRTVVKRFLKKLSGYSYQGRSKQ